MEFSDRVWRSSHLEWLNIATGEVRLTPEIERHLANAKRRLRDIEERYGKEDRDQNDFDCGTMFGKLSALVWLEGEEWNSVDMVDREADEPFSIRRSDRDISKPSKSFVTKYGGTGIRTFYTTSQPVQNKLVVKRFLPLPKRPPAVLKRNMESEISDGRILSGECLTASYPHCDG